MANQLKGAMRFAYAAEILLVLPCNEEGHRQHLNTGKVSGKSTGMAAGAKICKNLFISNVRDLVSI
jgi:hypothetical protein